MSENEKIMFTKFYDPSLKYTSIRKLYDALKKSGITLREVKEFIQKQETTQVFKKQKRIKNYFPIVAKYNFEVCQLDLVDMSNISTVNENYKYLLVCVNVFSRMAFAVPMKNKKESTIIESMKLILKFFLKKMYGLAALLVALPLLIFSFYKGLLKTRCAPVFAPVAGSLHAWLRVGSPVFTKFHLPLASFRAAGWGWGVSQRPK